MTPKKILIADDHPVFKMGLSLLLKHEWPDLELLTLKNGLEVLENFEKFNPDLIFMDYRMPLLDGYETSDRILKKNSKSKIVLLTMFDSFPIAINFLRIGGKGFLSKEIDTELIIKAVTSIHLGGYYFHSSHELQILEYIENGMRKNIPKISFSPRELQVCLKISKGLTNREISKELQLGLRTVETYRQNLIEKTGVKNSPELITYIYRNGIRL